MWSIAGILAVSGAMMVIEIPSLIKVSILLLAGAILNIVINIGIEITSPLIWIKRLYEPFGLFIQGIMKARS